MYKTFRTMLIADDDDDDNHNNNNKNNKFMNYFGLIQEYLKEY
jgi:hypothetical protein